MTEDQSHAAMRFRALEQLLEEPLAPPREDMSVTIYPTRVAREPEAVSMSPSKALRYTEDPERAAAAEATAAPRRVVRPEVSLAALWSETVAGDVVEPTEGSPADRDGSGENGGDDDDTLLISFLPPDEAPAAPPPEPEEVMEPPAPPAPADRPSAEASSAEQEDDPAPDAATPLAPEPPSLAPVDPPPALRAPERKAPAHMAEKQPWWAAAERGQGRSWWRRLLRRG